MAGISLAGVSKRFGTVDVIRDVSFEVASGEFVVFLGPSGSGKTTLLRMIAGLEEHRRRRRSTIDGVRSNDAAGAARHRDGVPELRALSAHDGAREHGVRAAQRRRAEAEIARAGGEAARMLEIEALLDRRPRSCRADSGSGSRSAGRSSGARRRSCSTSRCRTSMRSCAPGCASSSPSCTSELGVDDDLRHPRPGRGDDARRPDRGAERRPIEQVGPPMEVYAGPASRSSPASSGRRR